MKIFESLKFVQESNVLMASLNEANKEVFIIKYFESGEESPYLIIHYSKEIGEYVGEEGTFFPEEFIEEFPDYEKMEFAKIGKKGINALYEIWEYASETIKRNLI